MKRYIIMFVVAVFTLLTTSCNKDIVDPLANLVKTPVIISASHKGNAPKVRYSEDGNAIRATWEEGDQLKVVVDGQVSTLSLESGAGTASAKFSGTVLSTPPSNPLQC